MALEVGSSPLLSFIHGSTFYCQGLIAQPSRLVRALCSIWYDVWILRPDAQPGFGHWASTVPSLICGAFECLGKSPQAYYLSSKISTGHFRCDEILLDVRRSFVQRGVLIFSFGKTKFHKDWDGSVLTIFAFSLPSSLYKIWISRVISLFGSPFNLFLFQDYFSFSKLIHLSLSFFSFDFSPSYSFSSRFPPSCSYFPFFYIHFVSLGSLSVNTWTLLCLKLSWCYYLYFIISLLDHRHLIVILTSSVGLAQSRAHCGGVWSVGLLL